VNHIKLTETPSTLIVTPTTHTKHSTLSANKKPTKMLCVGYDGKNARAANEIMTNAKQYKTKDGEGDEEYHP